VLADALPAVTLTVMDTVLGKLAVVACGGGLGAMARYGLDAAVRQLWPGLASRFPVGILLVNISGCLLFGLVVGLAGNMASLSASRRLFLLTGVLGGFTTFSTFGHDTARLIADGTGGLALLNAGASVIFGVGAVFAGLWLGRVVTGG
jgi:CrcB protein